MQLKNAEELSDCRLQITDYRLQITDCKLQIRFAAAFGGADWFFKSERYRLRTLLDVSPNQMLFLANLSQTSF